MQLSSALLCDFAQVRDGLLFVSSGGVTRLYRSDFPAPMGVCLALVMEAHPTEATRPHELQVIIQGQDGERVAELTAGFQLSADSTAALETGENVQLPQALDLRPVGLTSSGPHTIEILIDGVHARTMPFSVQDKPAT